MSSAFMATFAVEDEAQEFFGDHDDFDYGLDYRHLFIQTVDQGVIQFPMVLDFDLALHLNDTVTFSASAGFYSRERTFETRENFIQVKFPLKITSRIGLYIPVFGINTNDHSLFIKRNVGLGRGSEQYNLELHHGNKYGQVFYTLSTPSFKFTSNDENFYQVLLPPNSQTHYVRLSGFIKRSEFGVNFLKSSFNQVQGIFFKTSPIKNIYGFYEYDWSKDTRQLYARIGGFYFRGFDTYIEWDQTDNSFGGDRNIYLGLDWMVRPRFEISFKINLSQDKPHYYQTHLWL